MATRRARPLSSSTSSSSPASALAAALKQLAGTDDGKFFARDVCEEFPHIASDYQAVCPNRMDLGTMCKKAAAGSYHNIADVITDVQLMVNNCITYNGLESEYGQRAVRLGEAATLIVRTNFAEGGAAAAGGVELAGAQSQQVERDSVPLPPPPSSHSLPHASNVDGTTASSSSATEQKEVRRMRLSTGSRTDGKRDREGEGATAATATAPPAVPKYTTRQLLELVKSFERREDEGTFSHDPVQMYPHIAVDYDAICPQRMDLAKMQGKARKGEYSGEPGLDSLVADVRLIAGNCQRYNGAESLLGVRAQSFLDDALVQVQSFLADPSSWVPASQSMSRTSASIVKKPTPQLNHNVGTIDESTNIASGNATTSITSAAGTAPATVATAVPPSSPPLEPPPIRPLSFQLPLHVPAMLREYLLAESLRRDQARWTALPLDSAETVVSTVRRFCQCLDQEAATLRADGDRTTALLRSSNGTGAAPSARTTVKVEVQNEFTATEDSANAPVAAKDSDDTTPSQATIHHASACIVAARTKERYALHAQTTLTTLMDVFEDLLPVSLLTRSERCDVDAFLAKFPRDSVAADAPQQDESHRSASGISLLDGQNRFWSSRTHVRYFVRLLLQVPELGTLTITRSTMPTSPFATAFAAASTTAGKISLLKQFKVSDHVLTRMRQVVPVVEDFLCFIDACRCCTPSA